MRSSVRQEAAMFATTLRAVNRRLRRCSVHTTRGHFGAELYIATYRRPSWHYHSVQMNDAGLRWKLLLPIGV